MNNDKVLLAALKERTAASGTRCLSGWLGKAGIVSFLDREAPDGETHWQIYAQTPDEQRNQGATGMGNQRSDPGHGRGESRGDRRDAGRQQGRPAQHQARQPPPPGELDDALPF